jgi:starvation-inducible DNA-binding protein
MKNLNRDTSDLSRKHMGRPLTEDVYSGNTEKDSLQKDTSAVIQKDHRASTEVIESLNHILANEFTLFTKTLNYHWNVTGPRFHSLHVFFETQYKALLTVMDEVAERVRMLGEAPVSTLREMRSDNTIIETPGEFMSADKMINDLLAGHVEIQRQIASALELDQLDPGTEDFLTSLLRDHEKSSWMLKSHLM